MDLFYSYNINIRTCTVSKKGCRHENTEVEVEEKYTQGDLNDFN